MNRLNVMIAQKTVVLLVIVCSALLLIGLSYVMAGDEVLLFDVPGAVAAQDTAVSRAKRVAINWNALENAQNRRLAINLFDGEVIAVTHDRTVPAAAGDGFVWVGHVPGEDNSSVTLAVVEGVLVGSIALDGIERYRISSNGQWQELQKIDPSKRLDLEGADTLLAPRMAEEQPSSSDLCEDGSRIDLLVAYTPAARSQVGGTAAIGALINQRVAEMNTANANSGLSFSYRLVHVMETAYAETGDVEKDLDRLVDNTDPYLGDVIAARDQHLADMTALIIGQATAGYACGIAYLMTDLSTNFADYALNVTALDYADPYSCHPVTLAHEFGHSMGNQHDRANAGGSSIFPYSYGYQSPNETFRTIMAYDCAGDSCPVANLWSNPDVSYAGEPAGIDYEANPSSSADNVRSMAQTAYYVANFRQNCESEPAPTATSTPTATNTPVTNTPTATSTPSASSTAEATYTPESPPGSTATAAATATRSKPLQPWIFLPMISDQ